MIDFYITLILILFILSVSLYWGYNVYLREVDSRYKVGRTIFYNDLVTIFSETHAYLNQKKQQFSTFGTNTKIFAPTMGLELEKPISDKDCIISCSQELVIKKNILSKYLYAKYLSINSPDYISTQALIGTEELLLKTSILHTNLLLSDKKVVLDCLEANFQNMRGKEIYINAGEHKLYCHEYLFEPNNKIKKNTNYSEKNKLVKKSLLFEEKSIIEDNIICHGDVRIKSGSIILGSLKIYGNLFVGNNVVFEKDIIVNGKIEFDHCIKVKGSCIAKKSVEIQGPFFFSLENKLENTLSGKRIFINGPFIGSGTLIAKVPQGINIK